mmetsp:Transcript_44638/g.49806  ORF Transcript_44638/g.49806 Transcript_44638/m.49806 type:complete len:84 (+) Transcript_44638:3236-3487(+)
MIESPCEMPMIKNEKNRGICFEMFLSFLIPNLKTSTKKTTVIESDDDKKNCTSSPFSIRWMTELPLTSYQSCYFYYEQLFVFA